MSREKIGYRLNIEMLNDRFPEKDMLSISDVCRFTGRNYRTVRKHITFGPGKLITKADLARQISA